MKIHELKLRNFQIHKDLVINFDNRINVIIGDTNAGKSSLVRALNLLLNNQPRNAEKIFQNKYDDKPLSIEIKDEKGNSIRRTNKKYYINGELLKAIGSDIPEPIKELFPLTKVNWQRQLDPHFLVLDTGGTAAKILNASSGLEEQEMLMKDIKSKMSEHKGNIKRLIKNNQEAQETAIALRSVNRLLMKAKFIKNLENDSIILEKQMIELIKLVTSLSTNDFDESLYQSIEDRKNELNSIESMQDESNDLNDAIVTLNTICSQINELESIYEKAEIYNKLVHSINSIESESNHQLGNISLIMQLTNLIDQIRNTDKEIDKYSGELEWYENEFSKKLVDAGQCPFCGTIFNKEKHLC